MKKMDLEKYLKKRGRYTHKAFWETILVMQKGFSSEMKVSSKRASEKGFADLYSQILC